MWTMPAFGMEALLLVVGLVLGYAAFRLLHQSRYALLKEHLKQATERAEVAERSLQGRDQEITRLRDERAGHLAQLSGLHAELAATQRHAAEVQDRLLSVENVLREAQRDLLHTSNHLSEATARSASLSEQWAEAKAQHESLQRDFAELQSQWMHLRAAHAELETLREQDAQRLIEQRALLDDARTQLSDTFKALSADALRQSSTQFLELAKESLAQHTEAAKGELSKREEAVGAMVQPLREALTRVETYVQQVEKERTDAYAGLKEQVSSLNASQLQLRQETSQLVNALRAPQVRGRWGEVQLRRVVELAGMVNYCDFQEQVGMVRDGAALRPDMIIRLPSKRTIVVDSKVSLDAYLKAHELTDEQARESELKRHAAQVRTHVTQLGQRAYTQGMEESPEFVVLFLPGEPFFSAALQYDPSLIEFGVERGVILATPTTLIALLKAVHYGWRQESLAENARTVQQLGEELYRRLSTLSGHLSRTGRHLGQAVGAYNDTVASFETRFVRQVERFTQLGAGLSDPLPSVDGVEQAVRLPSRTDFSEEP